MTTLDLFPDPARSRVQMFLAPTVTPITVYRHPDPDPGAAVPVRGAVSVTSDTIVDDYECPLDVPVTYLAVPDDPAAPVEATATVTLDGSVIGLPVLVHPTDPTRNLPVVLVDDTPVEAVSRGTVHHIIGARLPVVTHGPRNDVRRELRVWVAYDALPLVWQATDDGSPLLVKVPAGCALTPGWRWVERIVAAKRGQDPRGRQGMNLTLTTFDVDTPTGYVTADPVNSWAAVQAYTPGGTWQAVKDTYPTWLDVRTTTFPVGP